MIPGDACVGVAHEHPLAGVAQLPNLVGSHLLDVPFYPLGAGQIHVRDAERMGVAPDAGLEQHRGYPGLPGKGVPQLGPALDLDHVDQIVGPEIRPSSLQLSSKRSLAALGCRDQCLVHPGAPLQRIGDGLRRAQIGLFFKKDEESVGMESWCTGCEIQHDGASPEQAGQDQRGYGSGRSPTYRLRRRGQWGYPLTHLSPQP